MAIQRPESLTELSRPTLTRSRARAEGAVTEAADGGAAATGVEAAGAAAERGADAAPGAVQATSSAARARDSAPSTREVDARWCMGPPDLIPLPPPLRGERVDTMRSLSGRPREWDLGRASSSAIHGDRRPVGQRIGGTASIKS